MKLSVRRTRLRGNVFIFCFIFSLSGLVAQHKFTDGLNVAINYHNGYMVPEYSNFLYVVNDPIQSASLNISKSVRSQYLIGHNDGSRQWIFSEMAGIKKDYRFFKKVKGFTTVQFDLINIFNPTYKSPYGDVINTRIGFEFPVKKKHPAAKKP